MLSDEEKEAVDKIKTLIQYLNVWKENFTIVPEDVKYLVTILNLIEKQSKEIELLKEENEKYKNPPFFDEDKYIENDKIKAKIEEIDEVLKGQLIEKIRVYFEAQKEVLQSLLEIKQEEN